MVSELQGGVLLRFPRPTKSEKYGLHFSIKIYFSFCKRDPKWSLSSRCTFGAPQALHFSIKIYNLHLLYQCFIYSYICPTIFSKSPTFILSTPPSPSIFSITTPSNNITKSNKKLGMSLADTGTSQLKYYNSLKGVKDLNNMFRTSSNTDGFKPKNQMVNNKGLISFFYCCYYYG